MLVTGCAVPCIERVIRDRDTIRHNSQFQGELEPLEGTEQEERKDKESRYEQGWVALVVVGGVGSLCWCILRSLL